jgi:hypothetical protein
MTILKPLSYNNNINDIYHYNTQGLTNIKSYKLLNNYINYKLITNKFTKYLIYEKYNITINNYHY